jgi:hypothetical protein
VYEVNISARDVSKAAALVAEIPDIRFPPKSDAMTYLSSYMGSVFLRNRYSYLDDYLEVFSQIYSSSVGPADSPLVPATAPNVTVFIGLLMGMYPDSIKAFTAYLAVKASIRLLWSQLSLEVLNMILMETMFLTSTGRLDEGSLII